MLRWAAWVVAALGLGWAQVVPYGYNLERGTRVAIFVKSGCKPCLRLAAQFKELSVLKKTSITFIAEQSLPNYQPLIVDSDKFLQQTLRVDRFPLVIVFREGLEIMRIVKTSALSISTVAEQVRNGSFKSKYSFKISAGARIVGTFANYTGLVVFWKQGCPWCEKERDTFEAMCRSGLTKITIVGVNTRKWPKACPGRYDPQVYSDWGIPGAPTSVLLRKGRVIWVDLGYREEFKRLVSLALKK
ncbi:MAG: conjugal transfer protein TraF [Deinococcus sp.]|nr:conjugal transfer protein TraF [Deinococcus sp.]MCL5964716.1 conjugal transfer protein TraF [Deinococcus sp.]